MSDDNAAAHNFNKQNLNDIDNVNQIKSPPRDGIVFEGR